MNEFENNIISIYGSEGIEWLEALPDLIEKIANTYNLAELTPVDNMSYHYVASGYQGDMPVILKLGLNQKAFEKEASCLKDFSNHSVPKILAVAENMIIMQRAEPGTSLKRYFPTNDDLATKTFCSIIRDLQNTIIPENHEYYHLKDLFKTLDKDLAIPHEILTKARYLKEELLSTTSKEVLLHGDLHHDNILQNHDEWWVIDPKGLIGDPAFEVAAYLCNPMPELVNKADFVVLSKRRIALCSEELRFPEQRIRDCLYAKAVLCWAWSLEDNLDAGYWQRLLSHLDEMIG